MGARSVLLLVVALAGIVTALGVAFGPWIASLFVDDPTIDVDGPFNAVLMILAVLFAAPSVVLLAARRRFTTSRVKLVVGLLIGGAITAFELLMILVMVTDESGDGQVALILLIPIPFALLATIVLGIVALVGGRSTPRPTDVRGT